jgi:predicted DNA-binding transcriptional regulator AlpA
MGVFTRPDSRWYWMWNELTKQKTRTDVLVGETVAQRRESRARAQAFYQGAMADTVARCQSPQDAPLVTFPKILFKADVAKLLNRSVDTITRLYRAGRLPAPLDLPGRPCWTDAQILAWINSGCPSSLSLRVVRGSAGRTAADH